MKNKMEFEKDYYEKTHGNTILKGEKPLYHRFILRLLKKFKKNGRLLDIGCGGGFFLRLAENCYETYGIDISKWAIEQAEKKTKKSKLRYGDISNTVFEKFFFDIVTCFDVLEHIENPEDTFQKISRYLNDEGILLISVPNLDSIGRKWKKNNWFGYRDKTHISLFSEKKWLEMLKKNKFEILDKFYDGLWDSPYFKSVPNFLQHLFFKIPFSILIGLGIKFPKKLGENIIFITKKY